MAGKVDSFLRAPDDTSNTGKMWRTKKSTVSGNEVHEKYVILSSDRNNEYGYRVHTGLQSIQASAQNGTTTGFLWMFNPTGSQKKVSIDRSRFVHSMAGTPIALTTLPRVVMQRFTYTGTPAGTALTPALNDSSNPAPTFQALTASTGMTVSLVTSAILLATLPQYAGGTAGWTVVPPAIDELPDSDDEDEVVLRPGEGVVLYQIDAGTASDIRKFLADFQIKEWE